jgi:hypothetical protein
MLANVMNTADAMIMVSKVLRIKQFLPRDHIEIDIGSWLYYTTPPVTLRRMVEAESGSSQASCTQQSVLGFSVYEETRAWDLYYNPS